MQNIGKKALVIPDLPKGFWYDTLDSTQDEARRLIEAGQINETAFVFASHQTRGKGTHGREWISPDGAGIYLSIVHIATENALFDPSAKYTLAAGVASVEAIKHVTGLQTALKPVNDIYANGKKLGGILVESDLKQAGISFLITGIGINIYKAERICKHSNTDPVSLEELLSSEDFSGFSYEALTETLIAKVCFWYSLLFEGCHGQVQRAWKRYQAPVLSSNNH